VAAATVATFGVSGQRALAVEVLLNGGLEDSAGPQGWTLTQTISADADGDYNGNGEVDAADYVQWRNGGPLQNEVETPGQITPEDYDAWRARFGNTSGAGGAVNAIEHLDQANQPEIAAGQLGLLVRPFAGNVGAYAGQNKPVNMVLTQTFTFGSFAAGRTYTFSGHSYFQTGASNNIDTLFPDSPVGAAPSPTQTYFQMEFLNDMDAVLGSPIRLDLPKNRPTDMLPADWQMHSLMGVAPPGTHKVRVTAAATDMVASCTDMCTAGQDVYFDNFSLRDGNVPGQERLTNASLDVPGAPSAWTLVKTPEDNVQFNTSDFAIHSGNVGMWLRSFNGGDAKIVQTVPGTPGGNYTYSAWAKLQEAYSGLDPASNTQTFITMEFLDGTGTVIGSPLSLDLRTLTWDAGEGGQGVWQQVSLPGVAPAGTASVRVSAGATGMMNSMIARPQSAMFDDLSLMLAGAASGNLLAAGVPEPGSCLLAAMAALSGLAWRRGVRPTM
jgi:hypothetical protein